MTLLAQQVPSSGYFPSFLSFIYWIDGVHWLYILITASYIIIIITVCVHVGGQTKNTYHRLSDDDAELVDTEATMIYYYY